MEANRRTNPPEKPTHPELKKQIKHTTAIIASIIVAVGFVKFYDFFAKAVDTAPPIDRAAQLDPESLTIPTYNPENISLEPLAAQPHIPTPVPARSQPSPSSSP